MVKYSMRVLNKYSLLVNKLKEHPDDINFIRVPYRNKDMVKLLRMSNTMDSNAAVQFAIDATIKRHSEKSVNITKEKLEK